MRYVRFLRPPEVTSDHLSAKIAIVSDLGESYLSEPTDLQVRVETQTTNGQLYTLESKLFTWDPSKPVLILKFETTMLMKHAEFLQLHVSQSSLCPSSLITGRRQPAAPSCMLDFVHGARSVPVKYSSRNNSTVSPRLQYKVMELHNNTTLTICEEIDAGIKGKVWDGGLATVAYLNRIFCGMRRAPNSRRISVVELGSGTGIVGLFLAQSVPRCRVWLTDLDGAHDLIESNIKLAHPAEESSTEFHVLNWGGNVPRIILDSGVDMIVITDCTYNPDNASALVQTIQQIASSNPQIVILFASKQRHQTEDLFHETLTQTTRFAQMDRFAIALPTEHASVQSGDFAIGLQETSNELLNYVWFIMYTTQDMLRADSSIKAPHWSKDHMLSVFWNRKDTELHLKKSAA